MAANSGLGPWAAIRFRPAIEPSSPSSPRRRDRLLDHPAAAPLLPALAIGLGHCLPRGDDHEQPPDIVTIRQLRKLPPGGPRRNY